MTDIVDLSKAARDHRRRARAACRHGVVSTDRKGFDVCVQCGDVFPCRVACGHVDCLLRRREIKFTPPGGERLDLLPAVIVRDTLTGEVVLAVGVEV